MSWSDKYTNQQLTKLERRVKAVYKQAHEELTEKANGYFEDFERRYVNEFNAYKEGKYTDEQFRAWLTSQVGRGRRWETLRDTMAERYTKANETAAEYINNATPKIYAESANYEAFRIESTAARTNFALVNENAVRNLITNRQNSISFRVNSINPKRDYEWNSQQIQNALTQGILQGDSMGQMADRFMQVMKRNRTAAIRNARTSVTSAQNAGRQDRYEEAAEKGIRIEKEWIATEDDRTRDSHIQLDGVRVPYDEPFPNGLMYPGDSSGPPEEVYNCRCTMRTIIEGINDEARTGNDGASYRAWKEAKNGLS